MINKFFEWARKNDWNIETASEKIALPAAITERYTIPEKWYDLVSQLKICENRAATKWFLTPADYYPHENGFQWNEFELISLENDDDTDEIVSFWDKHLPVFLSVDGGYSYLAINTENGKIESGYEPIFEDTTVIADDFYTFIGKIISGEIEL